MAVSSNTLSYLIDDLTDINAGTELANAISNGLVLSADTFTRLSTCLSNAQIAQNLQNAMLGLYVLNANDLQFMQSGFSSADVAAEIQGICNAAVAVAGVFPAPTVVGMPSSFSLAVQNNPTLATQSILSSLPAGSSFSPTGVAPYVQFANAGSANQYGIYFTVIGGSNTAPSPAGVTMIQVMVSPGESAVAVANAALAAVVAAAPLGIVASAATGVLTTTAYATTAAPAAPSVPGGSYGSPQTIALASTTAGAQIYYTTNGSTPTTASTLYSAPFTVGMTLTLKTLTVAPNTAPVYTSTAYTISGASGVATQIVWTTQPSTAAQGVAFATQPIITIEDVNGATVTTGADATALITLTLLTGTGAIAGTVSMNAVAGVANFSGKGVNITTYGNKTLLATKAVTTTAGFTAASGTVNISNGLASVNLGTAAGFAVLAESGITNTTGTVITGNIGVSPIAHTAITGFGLILDGSGTFSTSSSVIGDVYAADYASPTPSNLTTAVGNMGTAYTDAAGRTSPDFTNFGSGELGGLTLVPGLYKWTTGVTISSNTTFAGGPNDVWILQISGTLNIAAAMSVLLSGGANPLNIFWQTTGQQTFGANSVMEGVMLSATGIAMQTNAVLNGRALAQTAVTLDNVTITP